jgi:uncharacterized membrane protein
VNVTRTLRHLFTTAWSVRTVFTPAALENIEAAIRDSEKEHGGQIRFAVEHSLDAREVWRGVSARKRAIEVFGELSVWDTPRNTGVLIYFLLADRDFEIVGDRGIHARVGPEGWERIAGGMEERIRAGDFEGGVIWGVRAVGEELRTHYPRGEGPTGDMPDRPVVM